MVDSTLAFNILARDLGASSAFEKVARSADKTSSSLSKTIKVSDDAAKASALLTKAHDNENDALGKVRVAEAKLADARTSANTAIAKVRTAEKNLADVRGNENSTAKDILRAESALASARGNASSKTSRIIAAEENLSSARRKAAAASNVAQKAAKDLGNVLEDEGKKGGKRLGAGILHWFTGAGKDFEKAGRLGGEAVSSGLIGTLKTPVIGPVLAATLTAAVVAVAPFVGAVAAGGIVAGFGAGLAGLGAVFAAKSAAVKSAWSKALQDMGSRMTLLSKPFEQTLINMAAVAKRTFDKFAPNLAAAFKGIAPAVTRFGDDLGRAFEKLAPAVKPLADAFNAVLGATGPALQDAFSKISTGLQVLAHSVQKNPKGLADLVGLFADLTQAATYVVAALNETYGALRRGAEIVGALGHSTEASGKSMSDAAAKTVALAQALRQHQAAAKGAGESARAFAEKINRQTAATDRLINSLFRLQGLMLGLSGAEIAYQQAIDDATASIKENGHALDINTAKGRANRTALNNVAQAANDQTTAMIKSGKGTDAAGLAAEKNKAAFIRLAFQMGLGRAAAKKMADQLIGIPNVTREARLKANKADLDAKLAAAKKQLGDKDLTKERRAKINADIAALQAKLRQAQAAINALHGKVVPVVIKYSSTGVNLTAPSSVGRRASGGPVEKGKPYIVGEHRPELFVPKQDGTIVPRVPRQARGAAYAAAGPQKVQVEIVVRGDGSKLGDALADTLRKYVRINGGDVQAVLGK